MTKIVIVAGGLATRMRPITEEIPKCMVDINGKPLILWQIEYFRQRGYCEIIFCVAHLAGKVKEFFGNGSKFGVNISYVQETGELLGTAGSVKLAEGMIGNEENIIVYYGDNLTSMDVGKFENFHKQKSADITLCIRPCPEGYRSSSIITLNDDSTVKDYLEKPAFEEFMRRRAQKIYINSGIYLMKKKILSCIPANKKYDFAKELFPSLLQSHRVFGYPTSEFFREIGRVEKYESFLREVSGKKEILPGRNALLLDRDGVINRNVKNLCTPNDFHIIDGAAEAIRTANDAGYLVIVVTNQPIIAKGFCTHAEMDTIHDKMRDEIAKKGGRIDAIYTCPHHPEKGFPGEVAELKIECDCRKPKPGLLLQAIKDYMLNPRDCWMIGDSNSDILAGLNAGTRTVFLTDGGGSLARDNEHDRPVKADYETRNLLEAVRLILSLD